MNDSNFDWADLSTFDLDASKAFYARVFGWTYHDDDGYQICLSDDKQSAGIYVMPEQFQAMSMPSFWMSYISVTDAEQVEARARELGGIVEIPITDFGEGRIALLRDPSGAGFTIWEGPELGGKTRDSTHGRMVWNELIVSDEALVIDFYSALFGWSFSPSHSDEGERYDVRNGNGALIAALEVIPNRIKGKEEFWVPYFAVNNMGEALAIVTGEGGEVVERFEAKSENAALVKDTQGAAFALTEASRNAAGSNMGSMPETPSKQLNSSFVSRHKVRTLLALIFIYIAVFFDWQWVWALLLLLWLIPDLRSGQTYLMEPVIRAQSPFLYWAIMLTWSWMVAYLLITALL